jgi:hypothetical protein
LIMPLVRSSDGNRKEISPMITSRTTKRRPTAPTTTRFVATVDGRTARLIRIERAAQGGERANEIDSLEEKWIEKEHGRPTMLSPSGARLGSNRASDEVKERVARFARDVAAWLEKSLVGVRGGVAVYCAPSLFGTLRGILPDRLHGRLDIRRRNMAKLTPAGVARLTVDARQRRAFP